MESKHTPGPWGIWNHPQEIDVPIGPDNGGVAVCQVVTTDGRGIFTPESSDRAAANARLIAAAPDLLAALESALQTLEYLRDYHPETSGRWKHMEDIDRARAAIAKARGE